MTIVGDSLVENCQQCYSKRSFSIRLNNRAGLLSCPHCGSMYKVSCGMLERVV